MLKLNKPSFFAALVLAMTSGVAMAGTSGPEFQQLFNIMIGWANGFLGKALSIAAFIIGAGMGIAKSTLMPAVVGIGFALMFAVGPNIISGIITGLV
jgi:conjugal transfer pilus assembly protein TraA